MNAHPTETADSASIAETSTGVSLSAPARVAWTAFTVLFAMNLLDYVDRNVLTAMKPQIATDFKIDDSQWGLLASVFLVSYSLVSPLMGWLGDRRRRTRLLAAGVGVWAIATLGSGLARSYNELLVARSFLGIGEATYGVIAPTILLDLFSRDVRARLLSIFYLAMPLGAGLGMGLGAYIATKYGWHTAFFVVGAPAVLAAVAALFLPEPTRGASEGVSKERLARHESVGASREDYVDLMVNSSYTYAVFGMAAYTFAIGGMLIWVPNYLIYTRQFDQVRSTSMLGVITFAAAILGMSTGGWVADKLAKKRPQALFLVPGVAMLASIPFVLAALWATSPGAIYLAIFFAELLMFVNTGPCNAIIGHVVLPNMRGAAYAVAVFAVHFLGDIWSPWLIGKAADTFGDPLMMQGLIGKLLISLGATPTRMPGHPPENIVAGLLIVVPALLVSALVLLAGARHLPREMALMQAKLRAAPTAALKSSSPPDLKEL